VYRGQFDTVEWRRSSLCDGGSCVEIAYGDGDVIAVRDSEDPGGVVTCTRGEWRDFVIKVKNDAYDFD
jgi:hypothetical protein